MVYLTSFQKLMLENWVGFFHGYPDAAFIFLISLVLWPLYYPYYTLEVFTYDNLVLQEFLFYFKLVVDKSCFGLELNYFFYSKSLWHFSFHQMLCDLARVSCFRFSLILGTSFVFLIFFSIYFSCLLSVVSFCHKFQ